MHKSPRRNSAEMLGLEAPSQTVRPEHNDEAARLENP